MSFNVLRHHGAYHCPHGLSSPSSLATSSNVILLSSWPLAFLILISYWPFFHKSLTVNSRVLPKLSIAEMRFKVAFRWLSKPSCEQISRKARCIGTESVGGEISWRETFLPGPFQCQDKPAYGKFCSSLFGYVLYDSRAKRHFSRALKGASMTPKQI